MPESEFELQQYLLCHLLQPLLHIQEIAHMEVGRQLDQQQNHRMHIQIHHRL